MKREFRAHPFMILSIMKPLLPILLIPIARGLIQYMADKKITPILRMEIALFLIILIYGFFRWYTFKLTCDKKCVTIKDGVIFVREAVIPIGGISSVQSEQNPIDYIFRCVTFRVNTEAGSSRRTDYSFKLSRKNSHAVSDFLYGPKKGDPVRFSPVKIAILAAATSSAFTGMLVGVPFLNNSAKLVGVGVNEVLDQINIVSNKFETYFPPIVNTVSLILLGSLVISFAYSFLKYINFRIFLNKDRIEVRSGFFVMTRTSFKKKSINNVKIEQTVLMRLLKRYSMRVNVGGYGEAKSESQILIPVGKYKEIKGMFSDYFPFLTPHGRQLKSLQGFVHENRYLFWAEIFFTVLIGAFITAVLLFEEFTRLILFLSIVMACVLLYYAYRCHIEYKTCNARFGSTVYARGRKGLRSCRFYCSNDRVGEIKLMRYPPDYLFFKTCNVRIIIRSEMNESILVKHLEFEEVKKEIYKIYNITE